MVDFPDCLGPKMYTNDLRLRNGRPGATFRGQRDRASRGRQRGAQIDSSGIALGIAPRNQAFGPEPHSRLLALLCASLAFSPALNHRLPSRLMASCIPALAPWAFAAAIGPSRTLDSRGAPVCLPARPGSSKPLYQTRERLPGDERSHSSAAVPERASAWPRGQSSLVAARGEPPKRPHHVAWGGSLTRAFLAPERLAFPRRVALEGAPSPHPGYSVPIRSDRILDDKTRHTPRAQSRSPPGLAEQVRKPSLTSCPPPRGLASNSGHKCRCFTPRRLPQLLFERHRNGWEVNPREVIRDGHAAPRHRYGAAHYRSWRRGE